MGVTIKDVAKKTGLSITTVSLVLNKKESRIPEKTRQIIENVAQELKYTPNQAAISLSTKKTNLVALIIPRGAFYFFSDLVSSIESACRNTGYALNISLPEGDESACLDAIREALRRGVDGVIFDPSVFGDNFYAAYIDLVQKSEIPVISLGGVGAHLLPNSIVPEHRRGGFLAASHLLGLGHTRIGFLAGPKESYVVSDLLLGIEDAFEEYHLENSALSVIFGSDNAAFGHEGLESALNMRPGTSLTGIICSSDSIAAGVLRRAYELGINVAGKLSVIGYGNISLSADYPPPLSTVTIHYDRIARKAVNLIKKLNQGSPLCTPELVQPSLIARSSTQAAALEKDQVSTQAASLSLP